MNYLTIKDNFVKYRHIRSILKYGKFKADIPMVSIIIPTYKRPDVLREAIDSALQQKEYSNYEVVIVDNDAEEDDKVEKIIQSYSSEKLFYYKNEQNLGMTGNWNRGIELARGRWITLLHDDDILFPDFLINCCNEINILDDVEFLTAQFRMGTSINPKNDLNNCNNKEKPVKLDPEFYLYGNISAFPCNMFRKDVALAIGGFYEEAYPIADYVFWSQLALRRKSWFIKKELGFYRISDFSETAELKKQQGFYKYDLAFKEELFDSFAKEMVFDRYKELYYMGLNNDLKNIRDEYGLETLNAIEDFFSVKLKYQADFNKRMKSKFWIIGQCFESIQLETKPCKYILWGTGSSAWKTKEMIDELLPDFELVAFIDLFKDGHAGQYPIIKPAQLKEWDYNLIFICTSLGWRMAERQLVDTGLKYGVDFFYGHGVPIIF